MDFPSVGEVRTRAGLRYSRLYPRGALELGFRKDQRTDPVAPIAQLVKGRLSDAGGPRFQPQTGQVKGKAIPSLWRDARRAIKGPRPPEHHAGQFHPDQKDSESRQKPNHRSSQGPADGPMYYYYYYYYYYYHHCITIGCFVAIFNN